MMRCFTVQCSVVLPFCRSKYVDIIYWHLQELPGSSWNSVLEHQDLLVWIPTERVTASLGAFKMIFLQQSVRKCPQSRRIRLPLLLFLHPFSLCFCYLGPTWLQYVCIGPNKGLTHTVEQTLPFLTSFKYFCDSHSQTGRYWEPDCYCCCCCLAKVYPDTSLVIFHDIATWGWITWLPQQMSNKCPPSMVN